jgi:hypothetical protein
MIIAKIGGKVKGKNPGGRFRESAKCGDSGCFLPAAVI